MARTPRRKQFVTVDNVDYTVECTPQDEILVTIAMPDQKPVELIFDDVGAHDFAQALMRGFDIINGI